MSKRVDSPLIIAHRGSSTVLPENTLAAFARSFDDGADGIELDVRLARDGIPVVIHNGNLRHTAGLNQTVEKLTSRQLSKTDVGSWFYRAHRGESPANPLQTIPTLDQVFTLLRDRTCKEFICYVEIKAGQSRAQNFELAGAVVELIKHHQLAKRTIVISFNLATVARVKELDASLHTGALFGPRQKGLRGGTRIVEAAIDCGAEQILLHKLIAARRTIARAKDRQLSSIVWTVDNVEWLGRAQRDGIKAVITNNPALMINERRRIQAG